MSYTDIQNIFQRYFQGKLTGNEYDILIDYLKTDENRNVFEAARQHWNKNPEIDEFSGTNLNRLQYSLSRVRVQKASNLRVYTIRAISIAAVLITGLLLGGILTNYFSGKDASPETLVFETPRGEKSTVSLPDGSKVWLNANSKLVYHSFAADIRFVELTGEAYFEVAHNPRKPFTVKTTRCDVTVLGTKFNVMAYKEFRRNEVTLIEGSVKVEAPNTLQTLRPGQMLTLTGGKAELRDVNSSLYTGWVNNKFNFKDIPLSELIQRLENWYDVDITTENKTGKEVNFTGTFKNEETIWQVLDAIRVYMPIEYQKTNLRKIKITVL